MKYHFSIINPNNRRLSDTRGFACEITAWRFVSHLSEREALDYLLTDLPGRKPRLAEESDAENGQADSSSHDLHNPDERAPLLVAHNSSQQGREQTARRNPHAHSHQSLPAELAKNGKVSISTFAGLNALEIAVIVGAKKFISHESVQRIINGIWKGDIIFWESLSVDCKKKPQIYHKRSEDFSSIRNFSRNSSNLLSLDRTADPYCRLRVPRYQKVYEVFFIALFLGFYYAVLVNPSPSEITAVEILLYVWIAAFAYDEFGDLTDAGLLLYSRDFWSLWDLGIITVGIAYMMTRKDVPRSGISHACSYLIYATIK